MLGKSKGLINLLNKKCPLSGCGIFYAQKTNINGAGDYGTITRVDIQIYPRVL